MLFISSNGKGMGHLVRALAIARRLPTGFRPVMLTMSPAVGLVASLEVPCENVMSKDYSRMGPHWDAYLRERVTALVSVLKPCAVVLDSSVPYPGVVAVARARPDIPFVWCRRALWKGHAPVWDVVESSHFAAVIEPGDVASELDAGATSRARGFVNRVGPITYLDPAEVLDVQAARSYLGLQPGQRGVLVSLGAGNINDLAPVRRRVLDLLSTRDDVVPFLTSPPIASEKVSASSSHVRVISEFPLGRVLRGFDLCVAASGYNSVHENLAAAVPTIYLPNMAASRDDQVLRARGVQERGVGWVVGDLPHLGLEEALGVLDDRELLAATTARCREVAGEVSGAAAAAGVLSAVISGEGYVPSGTRRQLMTALGVSQVALLRRWLSLLADEIRQSTPLRRMLRRPSIDLATLLTGDTQSHEGPVTLIGLDEIGETHDADLLDIGRDPAVKPVVLTDRQDLAYLRGRGVAIEHVMSDLAWRSLALTTSWPQYVAQRRAAMSEMYCLHERPRRRA